ncbi:MAG: hypothetical protein EBR82_23540 [Caulobacteraceae bacterium]|nr:hypothetical protein [Caulobacteraceae bacterium]
MPIPSRRAWEVVRQVVAWWRNDPIPAAAGTRTQQVFAGFDYALIGKTNSAHNKGANGTISVYSGSTAATLSDTGQDVTAYNRFGNIGANKWVRVWTYPWGFEVEAAEC